MVKQVGPLGLVFIANLLEVCQIWKNFEDRGVGWLDNEVDEANLTLCNVCGCAVEKLADWELVTFLEVSLREELKKEQVTPEMAEVPRLSGVGNVRQVEHKLYEKLFVLAVMGVEGFVGDAGTDSA